MEVGADLPQRVAVYCDHDTAQKVLPESKPAISGGQPAGPTIQDAVMEWMQANTEKRPEGAPSYHPKLPSCRLSTRESPYSVFAPLNN
jgi:hypothetical protein